VNEEPYTWKPFSVSEDGPLPMLEPVQVDLPHRVLLSASLAAVLGFGFGRISMDVKWMWRWAANGELSLFRSWTGFEIFRAKMRPLEAVPGPTEWEVVEAWAEGSRRRYQPDGPLGAELAGLLSTLIDVPGWLGQLPRDRPAALKATRQPGVAATFAPHLLAEQLNWQLPAPLHSLRLGDRDLRPDQPTVLLRAMADGDALRLVFGDEETVLWLQQAHDTVIERGRVTAHDGGVLLWPSAGFFNRSVTALVLPAPWEMGGGRLRMYDRDGEEVDVRALPQASDPWQGALDLRFAAPDRTLATPRAAVADALAAEVTSVTGRWVTEERSSPRHTAAPVPDGQALALEIARCPEIPNAWSDSSHPCHGVVHVQQDRPAQDRHLPEAWAGNPATSKVVFLSSNPSISDAGDATSGMYEEDYPRPGWPDEQVVDFMTRRFGPSRAGLPDWTQDERFLRQDGDYSAKPVAYWRRARTRATELLGHPAKAHRDYLMTEVVHCKSKKEAGVAQAASLCSKRYLERVLSLCGTPLVTVVGAKARDTVRQVGLVPEAFGNKASPPWADVQRASLGGFPRLLVYLPHFVGMEPKQTYGARYGAHGLALLRAVALGTTDPADVDWPAELRAPR
jgi:hypothetical protein